MSEMRTGWLVVLTRGLLLVAMAALALSALWSVQRTMLAAHPEARLRAPATMPATQPQGHPMVWAMGQWAPARTALAKEGVTSGPVGYVGRRFEYYSVSTRGQTILEAGGKAATKPADFVWEFGAGLDWGHAAQHALAPLVIDLPNDQFGTAAPQTGLPPHRHLLACFASDAELDAYVSQHPLTVVERLAPGRAVLKKQDR